MKKKHYKLKYFIFKILDIVLCLTPLIVYLITNSEKFFGSKNTTLSNVFGLVILVGVLIIILLKKTDILKGLVGLIVLELILIFLDVYIKDMKYILGYAIIGLAFTKFTTNLLAQKYKRLYLAQESAQVTADVLMNEYSKINENVKGSGRA